MARQRAVLALYFAVSCAMCFTGAQSASLASTEEESTVLITAVGLSAAAVLDEKAAFARTPSVSMRGGVRLYIRGENFSPGDANRVVLTAPDEDAGDSCPHWFGICDPQSVECPLVDVVHDGTMTQDADGMMDLTSTSRRSASTTMLVCMMPPAPMPARTGGQSIADWTTQYGWSNRHYYKTMKVLVTSDGQDAVCKARHCIVRWSDHYTPQLQRVLSELPMGDDAVVAEHRDDDALTAGPVPKKQPGVVTGGSLLSAQVWNGYCRATRAADVLVWKVGDEVCDMDAASAMGFNTGDDATVGCSCSGDPDRVLCANRKFTCRVSDTMKPGYYNMSLNMAGSGEADNLHLRFGSTGTEMYYTHRMSPSGVLHTVQVVPRIKAISAHRGSVRGGQLLTIKGSSLGGVGVDTSVDINGAPCHVVKATASRVQCITSEQSYALQVPPPEGSTVHNPARAPRSCEVVWRGGTAYASSVLDDSTAAGPFSYQQWGNPVWEAVQDADSSTPWVAYLLGVDDVTGDRTRHAIDRYEFQSPTTFVPHFRLEAANPPVGTTAPPDEWEWEVLDTREGYEWPGTDYWRWTQPLTIGNATNKAFSAFRLVFPGSTHVSIAAVRVFSKGACRGFQTVGSAAFVGNRGARQWVVSDQFTRTGNEEYVLQSLLRNGSAGLPERLDRALTFRGPLYGRRRLPSDVIEDLGACNTGKYADAGVCPGHEIVGQHVREAYFRPVSTGKHYFYMTGYSFLPSTTSLAISPSTNRSAVVVLDMSPPVNSWGSFHNWFTMAGTHRDGIHLEAGQLYYMRAAEGMAYTRGFLNIAVRAPPINASAGCAVKSIYRQLQEERYPPLRDSCDLFLEPIPGDMLFTREFAPQVRLVANGVAASCDTGGTCDYLSIVPPTTGLLPVITGMASTVDGTVATLTIQLAAGDGALASDAKVVIRPAASVTGAAAHATPAQCLRTDDGSSDEVVCVVNLVNAAPGTHRVELATAQYGFALPESTSVAAQLELVVSPSVTAASPAAGSVAGGTLLRIDGAGLGWDASAYTVTVGGGACPVHAVAPTWIKCWTPAGAAGSATASVTHATLGAVGSTAFEYAASSTPTVSAVSPPIAGAAFVQQLTLTGSNFGASTAVADVRVRVGTKPCAVTSVSDTAITCIAGAQAPGAYALSLSVHNLGHGVVEIPVSAARRLALEADLMADNTEEGADNLASPRRLTVAHAAASPAMEATLSPAVRTVLGKAAHDIGATSRRAAAATALDDVLGDAARDVLGASDRSRRAGAEAPPPLPRSARRLSGTTDLFQYELRIDSVSPAVGSVGGGTRVVVTGSGFASNAELNIVTMGKGVCDVSSANSTHIECVTRREWPDQVAESYLLDAPADAQSPVALELRQLLAKCAIGAGAGGCSFHHSLQATPVVANATYDADFGTLTVTGERFSSSVAAAPESGAGDAGDEVAVHVAPHSLAFAHPCATAKVDVVEGNTYAVEFYLRGRRLGLRVGRGINVITVHPTGQYVTAVRSFYAWNDAPHGDVGAYLATLEHGTIVLMATVDYYPRDGQDDYAALVQYVGAVDYAAAGVDTAHLLRHRPMALIGHIGGAPGSAVQVHAPSSNGRAVAQGPIPCSRDAQRRSPPRLAQLQAMPSCAVTHANAGAVVCRPGGLAAGRHSVFVSTANRGVALQVATFDVDLVLESVRPAQMSLGGGSLWLVGSGFSAGAPGDATHIKPTVYVDGASCVMKSYNATHIHVVAPQARRFQWQRSVDVEIVTAGMRRVKGNALTYRSNLTPQVESVANVSTVGAVTTFVVLGVDLSVPAGATGGVQVSVGGVEAEVSLATDTRIEATVTGAAAGRHLVRVEVSGKGLASFSGSFGSAVVRVPLVLTSVAPIASSLRGGRSIVVSGSGFGSSAIGDVSVHTCGTAAPCHVTAVTPSSVTCMTSAVWTLGNRPQGAGSNLLLPTPAGAGGPGIRVEAPSPWVDGNTFSQDMVGHRWSRHRAEVVLDVGAGAVAALSDIVLNPGDGYWLTLGYYRELHRTWTMWGSDNGAAGSYKKLWHVPRALDFGSNTFSVSNLFETRGYRFLKFNVSTGDYAKDRETGFQLADFVAVGHVLYDSPDRDVDCDVGVSVGGVTEVAATPVAFSLSSTPRVSAITPAAGTVAGGTTVTVSGSNFGTCTGCVDVRLDGVACAVQTVVDDAIVCITGPRPTHVSPSTLAVRVSDRGSAIVASGVAFSYRDLWSSLSTWGGVAPPAEGDLVVIPPGMNVVLDVSPPPLAVVIVSGSLTFADTADITLTAGYVIVRGGHLSIGSEDQPFTHRGTIYLTGSRASPELPLFGSKVLGVHGGVLDLHGKPVSPSWTRLSATTHVNDSWVSLAEEVEWAAGDVLSIASSDLDFTHAERVTVTEVSTDRRSVRVSPPLQHLHYGVIEEMGGASFDMRAEVALLTRNVVLTGDGGLDDMFGPTIMMHTSGGNNSVIGRFTNFECVACGQAFNIGRYPIHYHLAGGVHESFVRNSSVHDSFNRALTIHGVHGLRAEHNVMTDNAGHNIFFEDGIETKNILRHNLVMGTRSSGGLLKSDATPASFWITNPDNVLEDNVAAGSERYGFWYDLPNHPSGGSTTTLVCPTGTPLLSFRRNTAHSNGRYGLRLFRAHVPREDACDPYPISLRNRAGSSVPGVDTRKNKHVTAQYADFTAYMNGRAGAVASSLGAVEFRRFLLADHGRAGVEVRYPQAPVGMARTVDSVISGRSQLAELVYGPDGVPVDFMFAESGRYGVVLPKKSNYTVESTVMMNLDAPQSAGVMSMSTNTFNAMDKGARTYTFRNMTVHRVPKLVYENIYMNNIIHDVDGSFTGTGHETFVAGRVAAPALLEPGVCDRLPHAENAAGCDGTKVGVKRFRILRGGFGGDDQFMVVRRATPARTRVTVAVDQLSGADFGVCVARAGSNFSDDASYFMQRGIVGCHARASDAFGFTFTNAQGFLPMLAGPDNRFMLPRREQGVVVDVAPKEAVVGEATTFTLTPPTTAWCQARGHDGGLTLRSARTVADGDRVAFVPRFQMVETTGQTNAGQNGMSLEETNRVECSGAAATAAAGIVQGGQVTATLGPSPGARAIGMGFESGEGGEYAIPLAASRRSGDGAGGTLWTYEVVFRGLDKSQLPGPNGPELDWDDLVLGVDNLRDDESVLVTLPYTAPRDGFTVSNAYLRLVGDPNNADTTRTVEVVSDCAGVGCLNPDAFGLPNPPQLIPASLTMPAPPMPHGTAFHDRDAKTVTVLLTGRGSNGWADEAHGVRGGPLRIVARPATLGQPAGGVNMEPFVRAWSNATQWPGAVVPAPGSDVEVPAAWTLVMDVQPPALGQLSVWGTLRVDRHRTTTVLTARNILIGHGGALEAGTKDSPLLGAFTIRLTGARADAGLSTPDGVDDINLGARSMLVLGHLGLYGRPTSTQWTRLAAPMAPGDTHVALAGWADWAPGSDIVIAPTGFDGAEWDIARIASNTGRNITLEAGVQHLHHGASQPRAISGHMLDTRAEVALLSRNIRIEGVGGDDWGCAVVVTDDGGATGPTRYGSVAMHWVEMQRCGQASAGNAALHVSLATSQGSSLVGLALRHSRSGAIDMPRCPRGMVLADSVVVDTLDGSAVRATGGCTVRSTIVVGLTAAGYDHLTSDRIAGSTSAGFDLRAPYVAATPARGHGNIVAGSHLYGMLLSPVARDKVAEYMTDNTVHSARDGIWCDHGWDVTRTGDHVRLGDASGVVAAISGLTAWKCFSYGIVATRVAAKLEVTNVTVAYNTIGMTLTPITNSKAAAVNVTNAVIVGGTDGVNAGCGYDDDTDMCSYSPASGGAVSYIDSWRTKAGCGGGTNRAFLNEAGVVGGRVGMLGIIPHDHSNPGAYKWFPPLSPYMPWANIRGDAVFRAQVALRDVTFADFEATDSCGHRNWALLMNGQSSDAHPSHTFSDITWINVAPAAKLRVPAPKPEWVNEEDCGAVFMAPFNEDLTSGGVPSPTNTPTIDTEMQCTGLWNVLLHDKDGTLLGGQPGGSVVTAPPTPYGRTAAGNPACSYRAAWGAWECAGAHDDRHDLLWMENAGRDLHSLRLCPMEVAEVVDSPHTVPAPSASQPYRQQLNCFIDNFWDGQYTSGLKAGRFPSVIRLGTHVELLTLGRPPLSMRLALDTAEEHEGVIVSIPMRTRRTIRVTRVWRNVVVRCSSPPMQLSIKDDANGACVYDEDTSTISVLVKGKEPLLLRALNSVRASLNVAMSEEDFYTTGGAEVFAQRVALALGIDPSRVRIASVLPKSVRRTLLHVVGARRDTESIDVGVIIEEDEELATDAAAAKAAATVNPTTLTGVGVGFTNGYGMFIGLDFTASDPLVAGDSVSVTIPGAQLLPDPNDDEQVVPTVGVVSIGGPSGGLFKSDAASLESAWTVDGARATLVVGDDGIDAGVAVTVHIGTALTPPTGTAVTDMVSTVAVAGSVQASIEVATSSGSVIAEVLPLFEQSPAAVPEAHISASSSSSPPHPCVGAAQVFTDWAGEAVTGCALAEDDVWYWSAADSDTAPQHVQAGLASATRIGGYTIAATVDSATLGGMPVAWTLRGAPTLAAASADEWVDLHTVTGQSGWTQGEVRQFTIDTDGVVPDAMAVVQLRITACAAGGGAVPVVGNVRLYPYQDPDVILSSAGATAGGVIPSAQDDQAIAQELEQVQSSLTDGSNTALATQLQADTSVLGVETELPAATPCSPACNSTLVAATCSFLGVCECPATYVYDPQAHTVVDADGVEAFVGDCVVNATCASPCLGGAVCKRTAVAATCDCSAFGWGQAYNAVAGACECVKADCDGVMCGSATVDGLGVCRTGKTPVVAFDAAPLSTVEGGSVTVTVVRTANLAGTPSLSWETVAGTATAGADFVGASGTVQFAHGAATATFTVATVQNPQYPSHSRSFTVSLAPVQGEDVAVGTPGATVASVSKSITVTRDTSPTTVSFAAGSIAAVDEGGTATLQLVRSGNLAGTVVATFSTATGAAAAASTATADADFTAVAGASVTFAPGATSATATVTVLEDKVIELGNDETFVVVVAASSAAAAGTASGPPVTIGSPATKTVAIKDLTTIEDITGVSGSGGSAQAELDVVAKLVLDGVTEASFDADAFAVAIAAQFPNVEPWQIRIVGLSSTSRRRLALRRSLGSAGLVVDFAVRVKDGGSSAQAIAGDLATKAGDGSLLTSLQAQPAFAGVASLTMPVSASIAAGSETVEEPQPPVPSTKGLSMLAIVIIAAAGGVCLAAGVFGLWMCCRASNTDKQISPRVLPSPTLNEPTTPGGQPASSGTAPQAVFDAGKLDFYKGTASPLPKANSRLMGTGSSRGRNTIAPLQRKTRE